MSRLIWGVVGTRFYEAGVDRGVLYVDGQGHAWSGLVSVDESPTGGDGRAYYIDGVKYLNLSDKEEFEATISAFYSPPAFDACDGTLTVKPGLFVTQQPRKPFGFSYRTLLGNDIEGTDKGYKIHLIYNALAAPAQKTRSTLSDNPEAPLLNWSITTKPVAVPGMAPSAHFVVDTTIAPLYAVQTLEDILYGNDSDQPRLPDIDELVLIFTDSAPIEVTVGPDDTFIISGSALSVRMLEAGKYEVTSDAVVLIDENSAEISSP